MKTNARKRLLKLVMVFFLVITAARGGIADEPSRVVIVPFQMHADRDLSFLQEGILDMLTSRLSWKNKVVVVAREETKEAIKDVPMPINEETARVIGTRLNASHVLFGSLTMFGNSVSLDSKMVDVYQKSPTLTFFKQSSAIDEVIPQVNAFAIEIQEKVFGRPVAAPQQVAKPSEPTGIYAHPEKLLRQETEDQATVSGIKPAPTEPGGIVESSAVTPAEMVSPDVWKSRNFKTAIKGIALGDVDADGRTEVVFISDRRVYVQRFEDQRLYKIWEKNGKKGQRFIGVDVADINGNGRAEVFVTTLTAFGQRLDSFVVEWDGSDFRQVVEGDCWYYRVIEVPNRGPVLIGQKRRMDDLFVPGIYQLTWRNGEYAPQGRMQLPRRMNIFGFALGDVLNNGQEMIVAFDEGDHIRIFTPSGEELWKSDERYGGSMNYLEFRMHDSGDNDMDRLYLPQRIWIKSLDGGSKHEVIVASNQGELGRLFARFRKFDSGHMAGFFWNGLGLKLSWQSPKISGHISDYAIGDLDHDGGNEVVVAQVSKQGTIITAPRSSIIAYETPKQSSARQ